MFAVSSAGQYILQLEPVCRTLGIRAREGSVQQCKGLEYKQEIDYKFFCDDSLKGGVSN